MGQQQLLLIVLGVIVVGIAVVVGIQIFSESSATMNIDMTTGELVHYAWVAQGYYKRPTGMAGGGKTFTGWSLADSSDNAVYTAAVSEQTVTITGTCRTAQRPNGDPVTVVVTVGPTTMSTQVNDK